MIDFSLDLDAQARTHRAGYARLRRHLKTGGYLVREDIGPPIGVRWCCASRDGNDFDTVHAEKFMLRPFTIDGTLYILQEDRPNVFYARACFTKTKGETQDDNASEPV